MDPAADALERISVLIRANADWSVLYAFDLGASARWHANHCDGGFRAGIEMALNAHGNKAAILGWQNAAPQDDPSLNPIYKGE
jgi:hypothetical protein